MWAPSWHQYKIPVLPWARDFEIQFSICKMGVIKIHSKVGRITPLIFLMCLGTPVPGTFRATYPTKGHSSSLLFWWGHPPKCQQEFGTVFFEINWKNGITAFWKMQVYQHLSSSWTKVKSWTRCTLYNWLLHDVPQSLKGSDCCFLGGVVPWQTSLCGITWL